MPLLNETIRNLVRRFVSQRGEMVTARLARMMTEAPESLTAKLGIEPSMVELLMQQPEQLVGGLCSAHRRDSARI